jgi:glutamyl-tRNA reductase
LAARGSDAVFIANRGYNRAISLAERYGGEAVRVDELPVQLASADIVVSATNSPHHLIESSELELLMGQRDGKPLLLIDLAVPRDIDPECREIEGVSLFDVDEVQAIVERNASGREAEARHAAGILDAELSRFERWLGSQEVMPTVAALRERAERIVAQVLAENATRWESLSATDRERMEQMTRAIVNRLLHEPTVRLKGLADRDDAYLQVSALRELFGLDAGTEPEAGDRADVASLEERRRRNERS